jgi:hypothetical protein
LVANAARNYHILFGAYDRNFGIVKGRFLFCPINKSLGVLIDCNSNENGLFMIKRANKYPQDEPETLILILIFSDFTRKIYQFQDQGSKIMARREIKTNRLSYSYPLDDSYRDLITTDEYFH